MAENRVARFEVRLAAMKHRKDPWIPLLQSVNELFASRKLDFARVTSPSNFLIDNVFDSVPQFAAGVFASVCASMLWPDAARTFSIVPVPALKKFPGVEEYFRAKNAQMYLSMDRQEAGLSGVLGEYFFDQGVSGISGVATLEGPEDDTDLPVRYEEWDAKAMYVDENAQGYIDTVYIVLELTVRQVVEEYSKPGDKLAARVTTLYTDRKFDEKVEILKVLEPQVPVKGKRGVLGMKWASCHVDLTNRTIMREGGFSELPVAVGRVFKRAGEVQGWSPAMTARPNALNLNQLTEGVILAEEKRLDPPLGLLDDGRLGGAVVDTSAGSLSVFNTSGRPNGGERPIFPLFEIPETQSAKDLRQQFVEQIMQDFYLDRLLDLNNKTMMTAYETAIRNRLRGESTGSLFSRQITEVLIPTIRRTYNILHRRGYFGDFPGTEGQAGTEMRARWKKLTGQEPMPVPDIVRKAVDAGVDVYDIEFISPAQRFMQAEKLQGVMTMLDTVVAVGSIRAEIFDNVDLDEVVRDIYKYGGTPISSLRTIESVKKLREAIAQRQNAAATLEATGQAADIAQKTASARSMMGTK